MAKKLFTDRQGMTAPRVKEELDADTAKGLLAVIKARVDENWFGEAFPTECQDGGRNIGCDRTKLSGALSAYKVIQSWEWPNERDGSLPSDPEPFDLIEFMYERAALPKAYGFHPFFSHDHFSYDQAAGREKFAEDINRIFARNGMAFELVEGEVTRIAPTGLQEALAETVFKTGDRDLDRLLETAREKFLNRSPEVRKEGARKTLGRMGAA